MCAEGKWSNNVHIILGLLGSLVTILWLLHRLAEMGIDLGGLNPWLWHRRRSWRKKYEGNPIFALESPMEATAVLIAGTAKVDGDMTSEEKTEILRIFEQEFNLSPRDAASLLTSSTHMLDKGDSLRDNLEAILKPSRESFTADQAASAIELMRRVAKIGGTSAPIKAELVDAAEAILRNDERPRSKWN